MQNQKPGKIWYHIHNTQHWNPYLFLDNPEEIDLNIDSDFDEPVNNGEKMKNPNYIKDPFSKEN